MFLNRQGWETAVNKMIKAFGASIKPAEDKIIVDYLTANYSSGSRTSARPIRRKGFVC
jgi:hypothetical protein